MLTLGDSEFDLDFTKTAIGKLLLHYFKLAASSRR